MDNDFKVFTDTVRHRRPARLLYHFDCTPDLSRKLAAHIGGDGNWWSHYGCFGGAGLASRCPEGVPAPDHSPYWAKEKLPPGAWINGLGVVEVPSGYYHFTGYISPLCKAKDITELEEYPLEQMERHDYSHWAGEVKKAHAAGRPVAVWIGHMYENSWQIRGYEEFLEDTMERPEWAECLLERFCISNLKVAVEAAKAGADAIYCGDDVASQQNLMFSPDSWRKLILSRWKRVWQAAKAVKPDIVVHYHSDGNVIGIVEEMANAGLDILNPAQPECLDVDAIYRKFGDRISFDGLIGTQSTMPWGTPAEVKARVRECVEKYGKKGGIILSPTHVLEPEVPIANIEAFVEACREYR